ncbi:MAG: DUF3572 domain-containing protein [Anderseniella sp.]
MYTPEQAEILAIQALGYLAGSEEELQRLIMTTGMDSEALKQSALSRAGLAGLLDYICQDESILLGFCEVAKIQPQEPMRALHALQKFPDTGAA